MITFTKMQKIAILKRLAETLDLIVIDSASVSLSVYDCIALRDWIQTSNNGIERLKTGLEAIAPALAGLVIPPSIRLKIAREEKAGVIRSRVVELDCVLTRTCNRRGMRTYYYCENPMQLIMNMLQACVISGEFMNSNMFCGYSNQIFVALGGDKSDNDYVFVVRICNRKKEMQAYIAKWFLVSRGPFVKNIQMRRRASEILFTQPCQHSRTYYTTIITR